jgi:hypothetical protein
MQKPRTSSITSSTWSSVRSFWSLLAALRHVLAAAVDHLLCALVAELRSMQECQLSIEPRAGIEIGGCGFWIGCGHTQG